MTDRELLEMAAKAADIDPHPNRPMPARERAKPVDRKVESN